MRRIFFLLLLVVLPGCMPGSMNWHVKEAVSEFDGKKSIWMGPVAMSHGMSFILYDAPELGKEAVILDVGATGAHIFKGGEDFTVKIDGEATNLKSFSKKTRIRTKPGFTNEYVFIAPYNVSSKSYLVDYKFVRDVLSAKKALFRLYLDDSIVDGNFDFSMGREGFTNFIERVSR